MVTEYLKVKCDCLTLFYKFFSLFKNFFFKLQYIGWKYKLDLFPCIMVGYIITQP